MNLHSHSQETTASTQALDVVRQLLGHLGGWGPNTFFPIFYHCPGEWWHRNSFSEAKFRICMICVGVLFLMCFRYGFDVILFWFSKWFRESRKVNGIKIIWYHPIQIVFKRINIIRTTYVSQGLEDCGFDVEAIGPKDSPRSPAESGTQGSVWNSVGLLIVLQNGECWCSIADFVFMEI